MAHRADPGLDDILTVEEGDLSFFALPESDGLLAVTYTPGRGVWRAIGFAGPRLTTLRGARDRGAGRVLVVTPQRDKIARMLEGAALLGTGPYAIVRHEGRHTHLCWSFSIPASESPALHARGIPTTSTSLLLVKNPERSTTIEGAPPRFHDWLQARFAGRRTMEATPPELLDFVGAEIVLQAAADDVLVGLGDADFDVRDEMKALLHLS